ncbi:nucleotide exchange factor GrpE [Roseivirga echinicomitans]
MARIKKMFSAFLKTDKESMTKKNKAQENEELVNENLATDEAEKNETAEAQNDETEAEIELTAEEKLTIEVAEAKDKYLRLYSEFENFRRRNAKERMELVKTASESLMAELIPTIDDFDRAQQANQKQDNIEAIKEGFELIHKKILRTLEAKGLKLMETEVGTDFDSELHEAVTQYPVEDKKLKGKIIDTVEKGYFLGEKVIRFAKVVIGA